MMNSPLERDNKCILFCSISGDRDVKLIVHSFDNLFNHAAVC